MTTSLALGTDHAGFPLAVELRLWLNEQNCNINDLGAYEFDSNDDYPDFAKLVGENVDIKFKKSRKNETQFFKPNIEKIEKIFEYTNWINLNDGIKEML